MKYINLDNSIQVSPANNYAVNKLNFGDTLDKDYISQQFAKGANREFGKLYYENCDPKETEKNSGETEKNSGETEKNSGETKEDNNTRTLKEWEKNYFQKFDDADKFKIIIAANYLDCKLLLNLGCKFIADMIKDKSTEQIAKLFEIVGANGSIKKKDDEINVDSDLKEDLKSLKI